MKKLSHLVQVSTLKLNVIPTLYMYSVSDITDSYHSSSDKHVNIHVYGIWRSPNCQIFRLYSSFDCSYMYSYTIVLYCGNTTIFVASTGMY